MLNSLVVNASILITFLYLSSQLFRGIIVSTKSDITVKIIIGIIFGICGCVLMLNGVNLVDNMIMDFRIIALIISAIYCGPISILVTSICFISFRLGNFGINSASITATINLTVLSFILSFVSISKCAIKIKYLIMCLAHVFSSVLCTFALVKELNIVVKVLLNYIIATIIVSIVIYHVLIYLFKTNELYLKLKLESSKDYLTGLNNVREFDNLLDQAIFYTLENSKNLSLLMLDIDNFKNVNDIYGHNTGDLILKQFSDIIISTCGYIGIASRKGGEEFAVILPDTSYEHAFEIAERIRLNVQEYYFKTTNNKNIKITVSIGVSSFPSKTSEIHSLLESADKALYHAKRKGRNQVQ